MELNAKYEIEKKSNKISKQKLIFEISEKIELFATDLQLQSHANLKFHNECNAIRLDSTKNLLESNVRNCDELASRQQQNVEYFDEVSLNIVEGCTEAIGVILM